MSVTGKILHKKIQSLRADLSTSITPEILDKVCDVPTTQPFLTWFCDNISRSNILSKEELHLKKQLEHSKEWLSGKELDEALEEATRDNPELLKLIDLDDEYMEAASLELETLTDLYQMDEKYIHSLKNSISDLKELEFTLEDDIEQATNCLEKEQIEMFKAYNDCSTALEELDTQNGSCFKHIEQLLNVYTDVAEHKDVPILWTQMPIELFIKQIRLYNDYLDILIKRQFSSDHEETEQQYDSDYVTFINDSKEKKLDEQTRELTLCKLKLTDSKTEEVDARLCETSYKAMADHAFSIYNNGHIKVPEPKHLMDEIVDLTRRRDILDESVTLLRERLLVEAIEQYAETATTKVLQQAAQAKLNRRQQSFDKLKLLLNLTREHGHAYLDLLCMLMDLQFHSFKSISEFVADARHFFATEYSLSATRCENMKKEQEEYEQLQKSVLRRNIFEKLFVSMISGNDDSSDALSRALAKYDELIGTNKEKKRAIFETYLDDKIDGMLLSEKQLLHRYEDERNSGVTTNFAPVSYELNVRYEDTLNQLEGIRASLTTIRNTMKEKTRNNTGLKREKEILWQRFLADPDTLKNQYEEAKLTVDRSHFGKDT